MGRYLSKFLYIVAERKKQLLVLLCLFLVTSLLDALGIGLVGPFIGLATNPGFVQTNSLLAWIYAKTGLDSTAKFVGLLGFFIIVIFYVKSFLYFQVQEFINRFGYDQQRELRVKLLHAYLHVPYTFHLNRNSADLINTMVGETRVFCDAIVLPLLNAAANIVVFCALLLLLLHTDLIATVTIVGILLLVFLPYYWFRHKIAAWGKECSVANSEIIRVINHSLGGLKETRVIGCEPYFEQQLDQEGRRFASSAAKFSAFKTLPRVSVEALLITFLVGFTSICLLTQNGQNLTSVLGVFAMASIRLMPSTNQLIIGTSILRNSSYTLNKIYADLKELEQQQKYIHLQNSFSFQASVSNDISVNRDQPLPFTKEIVLDEISYHYPGVSDLALQDVSLTIQKGQSIALIGKSGAGKTTLGDLILGLLMPVAGDMRVDGRSVYSDLRGWQKLIGYIPQSIFLIDDTVERNIAFGVPDHLIDYERLDEAIRAAQLTELIDQLPNGVKTVVGERGVRFSGGQRQRVGIARALYHGSEILVLDEATAALDSETESLINESIKALSGLKTVIIIAHRLTTIQHCDRVYLLDKGQIVKSGKYSEVVLEEQVLR